MGPIVKYCKATMYYNQDYLALYFSNNDSSYWKRGSFIKRQRVIHRVTTSDNKWQLVTTSGTASDNEWQGVTMSDNKWYNEWQQMTTSDKEWERVVQRVVQQVTTRDNEWQRVTTNDNGWWFRPIFYFFSRETY